MSAGTQSMTGHIWFCQHVLLFNVLFNMIVRMICFPVTFKDAAFIILVLLEFKFLTAVATNLCFEVFLCN